jgi:hypothetical protein
VAFAEELPLSDLGKQRGERDVSIAGEAFAAAVAAARGIDREAIVELDADALSGPEAVRMGLADMVASLEDVMVFALARAGGNEEIDMFKGDPNKQPPENPDEDDRTAEERKSDDEAEKMRKADDDLARAEAADKKECQSCKAANDDDAKYCDECGAPFGGSDDDEDDDDPPSSKSNHPPPPERADRLGGLSTAELLGLRANASPLAVRTAALKNARALGRMMAATETKSIDALEGAVKAHAGDARRLAELEEQNKKLTRAANTRERLDLLKSLVAAGFDRKEYLVDRVDEHGHKTLEPAPGYRAKDMKLGALRDLAQRKLKGGAPRRAAEAKPATEPQKAAVGAAAVEAAKKNPVVIAAAGRSDATLDQLAEAYVAANFNTNVNDTVGL